MTWVDELQQAYAPFTGMDGVQLAQTLDQTSYHGDEEAESLRSKKNQVVYRWSEEQSRRASSKDGNHDHEMQHKTSTARPAATDREREKRKDIIRGFVKQLSSITKTLLSASSQQPHRSSDIELAPQTRIVPQGANGPKAQSIHLDSSPKFLVVRQLWLWKFDDGMEEFQIKETHTKR